MVAGPILEPPPPLPSSLAVVLVVEETSLGYRRKRVEIMVFGGTSRASGIDTVVVGDGGGVGRGRGRGGSICYSQHQYRSVISWLRQAISLRRHSGI